MSARTYVSLPPTFPGTSVRTLIPTTARELTAPQRSITLAAMPLPRPRATEASEADSLAPQAPSVAVVVLSWNGREDTLACLRSLARVDYPDLRVIVVDNASEDGSAEAVADAFPSVELIRNDANRGFAGGMNVGLQRALALGADFALTLNNDTEADERFVRMLVAEARRRPAVGALCAKILFHAEPDRIWYAGAAFDPRRGYHGRHRGYGERDDGAYEAVVETGRACAAAMLVPRTALERVGLFDESLFAYAEDVDWSLRARERELRLVVVPASRVWHKVSSASGGESSPGTIYYDLRNLLVVCERHAPLGRLGTWRRRATLVAAHAAQALLSPRRREGLVAVAEAWRDFRRGRLGARGTPPRAPAPTRSS